MNLSGLMLVLMREAADKVVCLPHGMVLTLVFEDFSISLEEESFKKLQSHNEYYDQTLHKIGYRKMSGHWVRRASRHEH